MPCFDKKLEAARTEFESEHDGTKVRKGLNQFLYLPETIKMSIKVPVRGILLLLSCLAYKCENQNVTVSDSLSTVTNESGTGSDPKKGC